MESDKVHEAAVIVGSTGGRPRGSVGKRRTVMTKADAMQVLHWKLFKGITAIPGDVREYIERVWAARIPHLYEELFLMARDGQAINPAALDILKTMTLMTRSLTPMGLKEAVDPSGTMLPSDFDLQHVSTADLARLARKELSGPLDHVENDRKAKHAAKMREKKAKVEAGAAKPVGAHNNNRAKRNTDKDTDNPVSDAK